MKVYLVSALVLWICFLFLYKTHKVSLWIDVIA